MRKMIPIITLGTILVLSGCQLNIYHNEDSENTKETSVINSQSSSSDTELKSSTQESIPTTPVNTNSKIKITLEDAIASYQKIYPKTTITSIDLDPTFGKYYYEVKGVDDQKEYEVDIDALTGEATKDQEERLDRDERHGIEREKHGINLETLKSLDEITELAVATFGGGEAVEWKLEKDHGVAYWEVELKDGKQEMSVTLNAQTGEILEQEIDD